MQQDSHNITALEKWLLQPTTWHTITNENHRKLVHYFYQQFQVEVISKRKQLADGEFNLLYELSIQINQQFISPNTQVSDFFNHISPLLLNYHQAYSFSKIALSLLYYFITADLAYQYTQSFHISIPSLLHSWLTINPIGATIHFMDICDISLNNTTDIQEEVRLRDTYLSKAMSISYKKPIKMTKAAFQYMYDASGNTYLDAYNNIPLVGHSHPKVVEVGQQQMARLNTNTRYLYDILPKYAERLLATFPASLNKVFFVNSGSAASDLAIRLAATHTQSEQVMVMEHGYHGNTRLGIAISPYKFEGKGGQGAADFILTVPIPDTYRGIYKKEDPEAGKKYAQDAIDILKHTNNKVAAFIAEPIIGCGGQVPLPPHYLQHIYPAIRAQGGVCISDEVQVGFGRLGTHFWGFEMQEVVPDIVVLGKPMGNCHPIAAVVCTTPIADSFANGMEFFSSFGGNPVSCAIGNAVLEVLAAEKLQAHALEVGTYFMEQLRHLQSKFPLIGDVRGSGLFIGVELVKNQNSLAPATKEAAFIKNKFKENYILVSTDGPYDNVLKIKPPLCFSKENVDRFIKVFEEILSTI